jgi:hypothetical protein
MEVNMTKEQAENQHRIEEAFKSYALEPHEVEAVKKMRELFTEAAIKILAEIPEHNARYRALVLTKLEEAGMFAVKGIARK